MPQKLDNVCELYFSLNKFLYLFYSYRLLVFIVLLEYFFFYFFIGHPQVIKVVQSTPNKNLTGIVGTTTSGIKVFKAPGQESQVLSSGGQVLRTISLQSPATPGQRK